MINNVWRRRAIVHRIGELYETFDKAYGTNVRRWPPAAATLVRQFNEAHRDLDEAERLIEHGERMAINSRRKR